MTASSPNVLFLVVDSLRSDVVFGEEPETPTLDRLAEESATFTGCFSQGISTAPSMTAMLTGRYPLDYGGHWYVPDDQPTMAEQFQRNGYRTAAIHSNPNVSRLRNFDKGFDYFEGNVLPLASGRVVDRLPDRVVTLVNKAVRVASRTPYVPADRVNDQIVDWLVDADDPWFLWTQYMDTHGPYLPGDDVSYRAKVRAERLWRKAAVEAPEDVTAQEHEELWENYRLEVEYLDRALGRFFDDLAARGLYEDTVVVLVGDHGDEFAEHGLYGHKNLPYDELVRVPLFIRFPDSLDVPAATRVETPVRCLDVLPTVLDAVDGALDDEMGERIEGESRLDVLRGEEPDQQVIVTEKEMRHEDVLRFGFRADGWTYLYDGTTDRELLYDRDSDPEEQTDVASDHPDVRDRFRSHLENRLSSIEATSRNVETPTVDEPPGVESRLKALGYRE